MLHVLALALLAAAPLVLVDGKVAQYREAADQVQKQLAGASVVDTSDVALGAKLAEASVVVAVGQKAFGLASGKAGERPIVFCMVLGVHREWVSDRVTGVPLEPDPKDVLTRLRSVVPNAKRVGAVYNAQSSELWMAQAEKEAKLLGVNLVLKAIDSPTEVKPAVESMLSDIDILWLPPDPKLISKELFAFLLGACAERKIPLFGFLDSFTQAGALASVSPSYSDIGTRAGRLAAEIAARRSVHPEAVPEIAYAPGIFTLNLRTAAALGLQVPDATVAEAKQVYR